MLTEKLTSPNPATQGELPALPPLDSPDDDLMLGADAVRISLPGWPSEGVTPVEVQTDVTELVAQASECLKILGAVYRKVASVQAQEAAEHRRVHLFYERQHEKYRRDAERVLAALRPIADRVKVLGGFEAAKSLTTPWGRFGFRRVGEAERFFSSVEPHV